MYSSTTKLKFTHIFNFVVLKRNHKVLTGYVCTFDYLCPHDYYLNTRKYYILYYHILTFKSTLLFEINNFTLNFGKRATFGLNYITN